MHDLAYAFAAWAIVLVGGFLAWESLRWCIRQGKKGWAGYVARAETRRILSAWEEVEQRKHPTARSLYRSSWIAIVLSLGACATPPPRIITPPPVCPALPERPLQASTSLPPFLPTLPEALKPDQAASEILRVRVDSAAAYQACRANNAALQDWVIHHSQGDTDGTP